MSKAIDYSAAFQACIETLDVALMRKLWRHIQPNLPQPENDEETLISLHMARTQTSALDARLRMYSHAWLVERGYPSQLPDHLRASAERMYPRVVRAVGISVNASSPLRQAVMLPVREAMADAVLEIHADDPTLGDDALVKRHMMEARTRTLGQLLGKGSHG